MMVRKGEDLSVMKTKQLKKNYRVKKKEKEISDAI